MSKHVKSRNIFNNSLNLSVTYLNTYLFLNTLVCQSIPLYMLYVFVDGGFSKSKKGSIYCVCADKMTFLDVL